MKIWQDAELNFRLYLSGRKFIIRRRKPLWWMIVVAEGVAAAALFAGFIYSITVIGILLS
jgi:hypothetical protein